MNTDEIKKIYELWSNRDIGDYEYADKMGNILETIEQAIETEKKQAVIEALGEVRESVFKNSVMILMNSHFINQAKSETLKGVVEEIDQKIKALKGEGRVYKVNTNNY